MRRMRYLLELRRFAGHCEALFAEGQRDACRRLAKRVETLRLEDVLPPGVFATEGGTSLDRIACSPDVDGGSEVVARDARSGRRLGWSSSGEPLRGERARAVESFGDTLGALNPFTASPSTCLGSHGASPLTIRGMRSELLSWEHTWLTPTDVSACIDAGETIYVAVSDGGIHKLRHRRTRTGAGAGFEEDTAFREAIGHVLGSWRVLGMYPGSVGYGPAVYVVTGDAAVYRFADTGEADQRIEVLPAQADSGH